MMSRWDGIRTDPLSFKASRKTHSGHWPGVRYSWSGGFLLCNL